MKELAAGYVLGNLSPEEAEALQHYTSEHPDFATEIDRLYDVLGILPYALPDCEPPNALRDRILAMLPDKTPLGITDSDSSVAPVRSRKARRLHLLRGALRQPWLAPTAAIAAIALGFTTWSTQRTLTAARTELLASRERAAQLETALEAATSRELPVLKPDATLASTWQLAPLIDDHRRAVNNPTPEKAISGSEITEIVRAFEGGFEFAPSLPVLSAPGVKLVSGTFCKLGATSGFRFTYLTEDGRSLSLYQVGTPDDRLALPDTTAGSFHVQQEGHPEILLWSHDGFDYALVAEMPRDRFTTTMSEMRYETVEVVSQ
ncbi:MAG: hypothetical protein ACFB9N_01190 [Geitlerinemataceae cyanobacterium]